MMKVAFSRATRYLGGNSSDDRERLIPRSTPIGAQVQNQKAASVYIFGDADVTQDEVNTDCDASEMHELRPRGKTAKPARKKYCENRTEQEIEYFERAVGKDDTLQSMALKYGCQVRYRLHGHGYSVGRLFLRQCRPPCNCIGK